MRVWSGDANIIAFKVSIANVFRRLLWDSNAFYYALSGAKTKLSGSGVAPFATCRGFVHLARAKQNDSERGSRRRFGSAQVGATMSRDADTMDFRPSEIRSSHDSDGLSPSTPRQHHGLSLHECVQQNSLPGRPRSIDMKYISQHGLATVVVGGVPVTPDGGSWMSRPARSGPEAVSAGTVTSRLVDIAAGIPIPADNLAHELAHVLEWVALRSPWRCDLGAASEGPAPGPGRVGATGRDPPN